MTEPVPGAAPGPHAPLPAGRPDARLKRDLLEGLLQRGRTASYGQILCAFAVLLLLDPGLASAGLLIGLAAVVAAAMATAAACRRPAGGTWPLPQTRRRFLAATFTNGLAWAVTGQLAIHQFDSARDLALVLLLVGLMAGAAAVLDASIRAFLLYTVPIGVSLVLIVLLRGGPGGGELASMLLLLFLLSLGTALVINGGRRRHLRGQYELENRRQVLLEMNRKLEEARLRAEEAAAVKQNFAAHVSHEIRTPMSGIIGISNMLLDGECLPEQRQYLSMLNRSAVSLLDLINDILDFSKLEARKMQIERIDYDLAEMLENLVEQFAEHAARKGLELVCAIEPGVPRQLRGDPGRLRQVLVNLVGNALKFTDRGEIVVRVAVERAGSDADAGPPPGGGDAARRRTVLRFSVRDTGIGIPDELHGKVFEPFHQAFDSTSRTHGGTGLGLSIVRQIADLMGAQVELCSRTGEGSTFSLVVPVELAAGEQISTPARSDLAGLRALVIDDNDSSRRLMLQLLSWWGCRPDDAVDAEEGIERLGAAAFSGDPYRLVLMDMQLPGLDGFEATRRIRSRPDLEGTTIVMVTGFGMRGDAARAREAGCAGYLTKPIRASQLQQVILGALAIGAERSGERIATRYTERRRPTRRGRILVAEDDEINRRITETLLRNRGHDVVCVPTGSDALDALGAGAFDVVLMDVEMPRMDGLTALGRMREDSRWRTLPVVALTAHAGEEERNRLLAAGMSDHLTKPFHTSDLDSVLERHLGPPEANGGPENGEADPDDPGPDAPDEDRSSLIDWVGALERHMGNETLLREGLALFRTAAVEQISGIDEACDRGDARQIERQAHALRGSAGMLGACGLAEAAGELERLGRSGELARIDAAVRAVRAEAERVFGFIDELDRRGAAGAGGPPVPARRQA